jgi:hypothetical protein
LLGLTIFLLPAEAQQSTQSGQVPTPTKQDSAPSKPPLKHVRVDLKGFELDKSAAVHASSTQIGGGSRGIGGTTTLLAPRLGRTYSGHPTFRWSHSTQAQNFVVQIFDESGTLLHKARVNGGEYRYPDTAPELRPGATYQWKVQPEVSLLGGSSITCRITRAPQAEIDEIAKALPAASAVDKEPLEQRAEVFKDHRLWFDSVQAYTDLIAQYREDPELHEKRGEIYDQLPVTNALAEEDFAVAEQLRSKATR